MSSSCSGRRGRRGSTRWSNDIVAASREAGDIAQSEEIGKAMLRLRKFMFDRVYLGPEARSEHERVQRTLRGLFEHYLEHPELVGADADGEEGEVQAVTDYVAGMTDRYAIASFRRLALPEESAAV